MKLLLILLSFIWLAFTGFTTASVNLNQIMQSLNLNSAQIGKLLSLLSSSTITEIEQKVLSGHISLEDVRNIASEIVQAVGGTDQRLGSRPVVQNIVRKVQMALKPSVRTISKPIARTVAKPLVRASDSSSLTITPNAPLSNGNYNFPTVNFVPNLAGLSGEARVVYNWAFPNNDLVAVLQQISQLVRNALYGSDPSAAPTRRTVEFIVEPYGNGVSGSIAHTQINGESATMVVSAEWMAYHAGGDFSGQIYGTIVHEMTHVFQYYNRPDATGPQAPQALMEGMADYIRFKTGHGTRQYECHNPNSGRNFNEGYITVAHFLEFCDSIHPDFTIKLNILGGKIGYPADIYNQITGYSFNTLWNKYLDSGFVSPRCT